MCRWVLYVAVDRTTLTDLHRHKRYTTHRDCRVSTKGLL
jgi:hypothetical protein